MRTLRLGGEQFVVTVNRWLHEVILGLIYLHGEGIVHGNLHLRNILIDGIGRALLSDYGMGALPPPFCGTAFQYRAPEIISKDMAVTEPMKPTIKSDIYSFALVCVELYSGRMPFEGESNDEVYARVMAGERPPRPVTPGGIEMPDLLWDLVQHCWSQRPEDRPSPRAVERRLNLIMTFQYRVARLPPGNETLQFPGWNKSDLVSPTTQLAAAETALEEGRVRAGAQAETLAQLQARIEVQDKEIARLNARIVEKGKTVKKGMAEILGQLMSVTKQVEQTQSAYLD